MKKVFSPHVEQLALSILMLVHDQDSELLPPTQSVAMEAAVVAAPVIQEVVVDITQTPAIIK